MNVGAAKPPRDWRKLPRDQELGAIAQLGERLRGTQEVAGSSPASSIDEGRPPGGLCRRHPSPDRQQTGPAVAALPARAGSDCLSAAARSDRP